MRAQCRAQVICGFYGRANVDPKSSTCWTDPKGLKPHAGVTAKLCRKIIRHCNRVINVCVHEHMTDMNDVPVGEWTQEHIDSIKLPVSGNMDEDEVTTLTYLLCLI